MKTWILNLKLSFFVVLALLAWFSVRTNVVNELIEDDQASVSICQIQARLDETSVFDDRSLLTLLNVLKMYDFRIGQPVLSSSNTLLYLCEHQLKTGLKHSILSKELRSLFKSVGTLPRNLAWTCV